MKIHIRVDDYPYGTPQDKEKFNLFATKEKLKLLKHLGPCMVGCVFEEMTSELWEMLDGLTPCFHGFTHGFEKWRPVSALGGEFHSQSGKYLLHKFNQHYSVLEKYKINICIPPFNSYTQELLDAINMYNFKYIIGGPETIEFNFHKLGHGALNLVVPDIYPPKGVFIPEGKWVNYVMDNKSLIKENSTLCIHLPFDDVQLLCSLVKSLDAEVMPYD